MMSQSVMLFLVLVVVFVVVKFLLDKVAKVAYSLLFTYIEHRDFSEGPIIAFRYVYKSKLNSFLNKKLLGVFGSIIFAFLTVQFIERWLFVSIVYLLFILIVQFLYAVNVYNMSKD